MSPNVFHRRSRGRSCCIELCCHLANAITSFGDKNSIGSGARDRSKGSQTPFCPPITVLWKLGSNGIECRLEISENYAVLLDWTFIHSSVRPSGFALSPPPPTRPSQILLEVEIERNWRLTRNQRKLRSPTCLNVHSSVRPSGRLAQSPPTRPSRVVSRLTLKLASVGLGVPKSVFHLGMKFSELNGCALISTRYQVSALVCWLSRLSPSAITNYCRPIWNRLEISENYAFLLVWTFIRPFAPPASHLAPPLQPALPQLFWKLRSNGIECGMEIKRKQEIGPAGLNDRSFVRPSAHPSDLAFSHSSLPQNTIFGKLVSNVDWKSVEKHAGLPVWTQVRPFARKPGLCSRLFNVSRSSAGLLWNLLV